MTFLKKWKLKIHPLIVSYKIKEDFFEEFKFNIKLYISKALKIDFELDDNKFIKNITARNSRLNITPNGAIVPKREFHLEYNLVLRSWCHLVTQMSKNDRKLLKLLESHQILELNLEKSLMIIKTDHFQLRVLIQMHGLKVPGA